MGKQWTNYITRKVKYASGLNILRLLIAAAFLFTSLHALGHTHRDGKIHKDCVQYLFLQQFSAEKYSGAENILIFFHNEEKGIPFYEAIIKSFICYGTLFPNAPPDTRV